jgi:multiple antibiotic resistance protein
VSGERLVHLLGDSGLGVITRLMGLILAVIGTQMVITGITGAIKLAH